MGFENLFFKKEQPHISAAGEDVDELGEEGRRRRNFLVGSGALAAATLIPEVVYASDLFSLESPEARESNVEAIRAYEVRLQQIKQQLEDPDINRAQVWKLLYGEHGIPATDSAVLEDTELNREALFRQHGSWPSVQIRYEGVEGNPHIRFANSPNTEDAFLAGYGNGFFVDDTLISNKHGIVEAFQCEIMPGEDDIGGCSVDDLSLGESAKKQINRVDLAWDRRRAAVDIHGQLVHIPSIHEKRGKERPDNTDVTSAVIFKVTPSLLSEHGRLSLIGQKASDEFREVLLSSYACIVPPRDSNEDGVSNSIDLKGISGSPIFLDSDCAEGELIPVGIEWGGITLEDPVHKVSHTVVFLHGPDVLGAMLDTINTVVSMDLNENEVPAKRELTAKVQMALHEYGDERVAIDGVYSDETRQAVFDFQLRVFSAEELESSVIPGVVDRRTWAALFPEDPDPNKKELWRI